VLPPVRFSKPVGVFGALAAAMLFGQENDVYFKVSLLMTIGLTAAKISLAMAWTLTVPSVPTGGHRGHPVESQRLQRFVCSGGVPHLRTRAAIEEET
jgi:hypothetical protein